MSDQNGNGTVPSTDELREQLRLARLKTRLAQAEQEQQLWESFGSAGFGLGFSDVLNPFGYRRDDWGHLWLPLGQGTVSARQGGRNHPFILSDTDLDHQRAMARWLATKNDLAIGALRTLRNLTIKKGYDWEAVASPGYEQDENAVKLAKQVQHVIDRYSDVNNLRNRERSSCWRAVRDGEAITRHFAQDDGTTIVRFVECEQLRDPRTRGPDGLFGVETDPDDIETPTAYHITYDGTNFDCVSPAEICHYKRNVDENIKRGISDFFSAGEVFDDVAKLLRNMRRGGALLSAIAWIEQFSATTTSQLQAHQTSLRDLNRPPTEHPVSGRRVDYQTMEPGTIVRTQKGKDYLPPPLAGNTTNFTGIVQAALRAVGTRWGFPEYFISGDASNNNFASILVAGSPLVNGIECEQDDFGLFFLRWRWIAVRNACRAGLIDAPFEEVQRLVDINFTPPQVAVANKLEEAQIDHMDIGAKVMSKRTRASRRDLEWEQEAKFMAEEPDEDQGQGQQQQPGMPEMTGTNMTPPAGMFPEARSDELWNLLTESEKQIGDKWQGPSGRWFTKNQSGRVVLTKAPGSGEKTPEKKPAKQKVSTDEMHQRIKDLLASGKKPTADDVTSLGHDLTGLTVAGLNDLKKRLGVKASGAKVELARKIAERAMEKAEPPKEDEPLDPIEVTDDDLARELQQTDPGHPVAKELRDDVDNFNITRKLAEKMAPYTGTKERLAEAKKVEREAFEKWVANKSWKKSKESRKVYESAQKKTEQAQKEHDESTGKAREILTQELKAKDPVKFNAVPFAGLKKIDLTTYEYTDEWAIPPFEPSETQKAAINKGMEFVSAVCEGKGGVENRFRIQESMSGRAYYDHGERDGNQFGDTIATGLWLEKYPDPEHASAVMAHELGHLLEKRKPGIEAKVKAFLEYRVGKEQEVDMRTIPGGENMKGERVRKDNFDRAMDTVSAYYCGKNYDQNGKYTGSEILSMGIEQLYRDPANFIAKDPEYAQFVISCLRA